jgi:predicted DNA binding CopG/RHH family protein
MAKNTLKQKDKLADQAEMKDTLARLTAGTLKRIPLSSKEQAELQQAAAEAVSKASRINIRISPQDLARIKKKAEAAGVPYQTLIGAILHQYASDRISATI